ncbi:MAG: flagellar protein FlgN [Sporomusaceae bacterium]|nr:flagellar protein FlgN [Sporomusaceae bacterium]
MKFLFDELIRLLTEILALYQELLVLGKAKKEHLVKYEVKDLGVIIQKEEKHILAINRFEVERAKVVRQIAERVGANEKLSNIKELAEPEQRAQLEMLEANFQTLLAELVPLNQLNTELVTQAMQMINFNINIMARTTVNPTYGPSIQGPGGKQGKSLLDQSV